MKYRYAGCRPDADMIRENSSGGTIRMPLQETFWAERFGMLVDRFGVPWMVNRDKHDQQPR